MPKIQQTRAQRLLSAIKPNTNKKRLIMFVVLFALIGGGYMTYKSFAATGVGVYGFSQLQSSSTKVVPEAPSGSKSNQQVYQVAASHHVSVKNPPIVWAKYVRVCANVRAPIERAQARVIVYDGNKRQESDHFVAASDSYQKICTAYIDHSASPNAPIQAKIHGMSHAGKPINVGSMSIEYY